MAKMIMFFGSVWLIITIAGGFMVGESSIASTHLTADISAADTTINVATTNGFPEPGAIIIGGERIEYAAITDTAFKGTFLRSLVRGVGETTAVGHLKEADVRTPVNALINNAVDYNLAVIADATGLMAFATVSLAIFDILKTFVAAPLGFLGTDLAIIAVLWGIMFIGLIVTIAIAMMGGRRV